MGDFGYEYTIVTDAREYRVPDDRLAWFVELLFRTEEPPVRIEMVRVHTSGGVL